MERWSTRGPPLQKWKNELDLQHSDDDAMRKVQCLFQKCNSFPVGGRGQRLDPPPRPPAVKYPLMKEKDIMEVISLYLVRKQLKISDFDDMKMLKELFAKAQSCPELSCDEMGVRKTTSESDVGSLSEENLFVLEEQHNYMDFLRSLDEKELFVIVQHIPLNEVKNIEALINSFGELVYFRDSVSINTNEMIVLAKMKTEQECSWVVSNLDGHAWGEKILSATNVAEIFQRHDDPPSPTDPVIDQFEDCCISPPLSNVSFALSTPVLTQTGIMHDVPEDIAVSQYLDLPSSAVDTRRSALL